MSVPQVELRFNPTDLRPRDLPLSGAFLGSPADAIEAALAVARAAMIDQMKDQVRGLSEPTHAQLLRIADLAWQAVFWRYRKVSAPVMADAYVRAYRAAGAGDVPVSVIYDLADKHAEKVGDYFHASSREALAEGFTTLVNRRVPAKAAADRVLDAYGLTKRQMRSYVAGQQQFNTPITNVIPHSTKAKARTYIDKAFTTRTRKLSRQEEHNIDEQAKQFAWMWLQDKGRLSEKAQKMWITAHDERVCKICGPLHRQKVGVNDQFKTKEGNFWTPGLHPNCRCVVRLIENRFSKQLKGIFAKADFDPRLHPRGGDAENRGRFSEKTQNLPVAEADRESLQGIQAWLDQAVAQEQKEKEASKPGKLTPLTITPLVRSRPTPLQLTSLAPKLTELAVPELTRLGEGTMTPLVGDKPVVRPLVPENVPLPHVPMGQPAPMSPTVPLSNDDRRFFAVIRPDDPDDFDDQDFTIVDRLFYDDEEETKQLVDAVREEVLLTKYNNLLGRQRQISRPIINPDQPELHTYITNDDLWAALRLMQTNPGDWGSATNVTWYDPNGAAEVEGDLPYLEICQQLGVKTDDMRVWIMETKRGHNDPDLTQPHGPARMLSGSFVQRDTSTIPDAQYVNTPVKLIEPYVPKRLR